MENFTDQMNNIAKGILHDEDLLPTLDAAHEVEPGDLCDQLLEQIGALAPFGHANHEPLFISRGVRVLETARMGAEKQHLRLTLRASGLNGRDQVQAPFWHYGEMADHLEAGQTLDLCYRPAFNHFNGRRSIQFMIEDIKAPEW